MVRLTGFVLLLDALISSLVPSVPTLAAQVPLGDPERHLRLGNPSKATDKDTDRDNFLMKKPLFALSYNNSKGTPNWVSWHLINEDTGKFRPHPDPFQADGQLPVGFHRVKPADYKHKTTGFERGHICNNADRGHSVEMAATTFVMTNMVPQSHELNTGAWEDLEKYCRTLLDSNKRELYIVAGPHGKGGTSSLGQFDTTDGTVVVPSKCWKVVLVLPIEDGDPASRVTARTRVISVIMPNDTTPKPAKWTKYRVSLKDVEDLTGHTFFNKVPEDIRKRLLDKVDDE
jgi:endonuclease G